MKTLSLKHTLWLGTALFIVLQAYAISREFMFVALLPAALLIVWAAFFKIEFVFFTIVFFTPLSINLEKLDIGGVGIYLPTEPLLIGLLLMFLLKVLSGKSIDRRIYNHPISYLLYVYIAWMIITTVNSQLPVVSLKFVATRLWFIATAFFLATHLFKSVENIRKFFIIYMIPLSVVVIYTVARHSTFGFDKDSAHWVMEPFFKDHTSYGAVLAMFMPISLGLLFIKRIPLYTRIFIIVAFVILSAGTILSYTRAAWISLVGAAAIFIILQTRIKFTTLVMSFAVLSILVLLNWTNITMGLQQNKQESSDELGEHVTSISNVSSDASNLERLNRWNCALEMWRQKPILGWGPGTYQFFYAPFQRSQDLTIISTRRGDGGNAHSEYLGPLCEQGVPGMALMILMLFFVSAYGFKLYYKIKDKDIRIVVLSAYLGLMTYYIHGILNNYLDTDKASIPFWGFTAILVAADLYHSSDKATTQDSKVIGERH
ncbi:MAG: O-antigen ligase family protein [Flavobacteriales bacterium]